MSIFFVILSIFLFVSNFIRVAVHGKSIIRPDFERVDRLLREKTGWPPIGRTSWNNWIGKTVYYLFLIGLVGFIVLIVLGIASLAK